MAGKNSPTTSGKLTHPLKLPGAPPDAVDRFEVKLSSLHQLDHHGCHVEQIMANHFGQSRGRGRCDEDALGVSIGVVGWKNHRRGIHLQEDVVRPPPIEQGPVP